MLGASYLFKSIFFLDLVVEYKIDVFDGLSSLFEAIDGFFLLYFHISDYHETW